MADTGATAAPANDNTNASDGNASVDSGAVNDSILGGDGTPPAADKFSISNKDATPAEGEGDTILGGDADASKATDETTDKDADKGDKADDKADSDKDADKADSDEAKEDGAPDKYEDFKIPEGYTMDEAGLGKFTEIAKEANLTQDAAQKFLDLATENAKAAADSKVEQAKVIRKDWVESVKADPDFGSTKFNETVQRCVRTRDTFGSPALKTLFNTTGLGDHPEIIKAFARIDRAIGEPLLIDGTPIGAKKDAASTLYPDQGK